MGCNNPNIDCLVSGDTLGYQVFGEGISPSGLRPSGDIPITSHLISQRISLNSSQYLVNIIRNFKPLLKLLGVSRQTRTKTKINKLYLTGLCD